MDRSSAPCCQSKVQAVKLVLNGNLQGHFYTEYIEINTSVLWEVTIFLWKSQYFLTYNSKFSKQFNLIGYVASKSLSTKDISLHAKNRFLFSFWCTAWVDYLSMFLIFILIFKKNYISGFTLSGKWIMHVTTWHIPQSAHFWHLPLLPSHAAIKNNLVFLKLLCSWVFPIIPGKELL